MPIAEIFSAANLLGACVSGVIGNRTDKGIDKAIELASRLQGENPENSHVLTAMHGALAKSLVALADACETVGGSPIDAASHKALRRAATSRELAELDLLDPRTQLADLESRVREIYSHAAGTSPLGATYAVISVIEELMRVPLSDAHRRALHTGTATCGSWAVLFELFVAAEIAKGREVFAMLTTDRLNELVALAHDHRGQLTRIEQGVTRLEAEQARRFDEVQAAIAALASTAPRGIETPQAALDVLSEAIEQDRLGAGDQARYASIYADYLKREGKPAGLVDTFVRTLADQPDPALLGDALRDMAGADRLAVIEERAAELARDEQAIAARYRQLASFAAISAPARALELYQRAVELDPEDFATWIELGRLRVRYETLERARLAFDNALQRVTDVRDRMVLHNEYGNALRTEGKLGDARSEYAAAMAIAEAGARDTPGDTEWQRDLAVSHNKLGDLERDTGNSAAVRGHCEAALEIRQRLAAGDPLNAEWQRGLLVSHDRLGDLERDASNSAAARGHFEAALAIANRRAADDPLNAEWQRDLSVSLNKLGNLERDAGKTAGARGHFEAALETRQRLAADDPHNTGWQRDLFVSLTKMGMVEADPAGARGWYKQARAVIEPLAACWPDHRQFARDLAWVRRLLGSR